MAVAEATPQRAVFHWINVTGERRLRFNYSVNLRFDRANASRWRRRLHQRGGMQRGGGRRTRGPTGNEMDWKNGEGEIIVMKLARLPLSAFMGVVPEGRARRALFHRANCYWLIDVDRFFPPLPRDASACGIRLYREACVRDIAFELVFDRARGEDRRRKVGAFSFL